MSEITSPIMLDSTGQTIANAISTMSSTSVGNLSALTTTDKTSLVGAVNELKSGLNDVNSKRIVRDLIDNGSGAVSITFSGSGHTRCANMVLICAKQSAVYPPIPIMFTGVQGSNQAITSVVVADNNLNVTASGLTITVPSDLSGWGYHMLVKLYPDDNIAVSVTQ